MHNVTTAHIPIPSRQVGSKPKAGSGEVEVGGPNSGIAWDCLQGRRCTASCPGPGGQVCVRGGVRGGALSPLALAPLLPRIAEIQSCGFATTCDVRHVRHVPLGTGNWAKNMHFRSAARPKRSKALDPCVCRDIEDAQQQPQNNNISNHNNNATSCLCRFNSSVTSCW
jgi:hypothetical protein